MGGRKVWASGDILTAADVNDYLMDQSVMVFAGTASRGSAIPSPTEGMVTYRTDADLVEAYNGTAWQQVGESPGLVKITDTSFTSGSSVILNNIFTGTYNTYRILMTFIQNATPGELRSRMRVGGVNASGATTYQRSGFLGNANTSLAVNGGATDHFFHGATAASSRQSLWFELTDPATTDSTTITSNFFQATNNLAYGHLGIHTAGTAYDGIEFYLSAGAFTSGSIRVYGYRN